jgi:hypothetical protein
MSFYTPARTKIATQAGRPPNFLIIGAAKSGTTSLWHQLSQHPQIFMHPMKQLNYFATEDNAMAFQGPHPLQMSRYAIRTWDAYCREFSAAHAERAVGEACNFYLYSPSAPVCIRKRIPDAKLIAVLRHPAERAHSRYLQLVRSGREKSPSFETALTEESTRIDNHWWPDFHYLNVGRYHEQISRYLAVFPASQLKIYLHEDMIADPLGMLKNVFEFLEVETDFRPDIDVRYSASGLPRSKGLDWLLKKLRVARPMAERLLQRRQLAYLLRVGVNIHTRNLVKPTLSPKARAWMIERYRDDTLRLQELLNRDLSAWLR